MKLIKGFFYSSLVFSSSYSFTSELKPEITFKSVLCQLQFQKDIPSLNPINTDNPIAIRDKLKTKQSIGGSATVSIEQPFSPETSEKLRQFLLLDEQGLLAGKSALPDHLKASMIQSGLVSPEEVNEIKHGLNRYFEQLKQLIFQVDGRFVVLDTFNIVTEIQQVSPRGHNHHLQDNPNWISTTHALLGTGTWYETIYNNKKQTAVAKTGETLLLSEPYRMHILSGDSEKIPHVNAYVSAPFGRRPKISFTPFEGTLHGSSPGKRLLIIAFFRLKDNFMDPEK